MSKVRVHAFAISLDGYGAGPQQDIDHPLGQQGTTLHQWFYPTRGIDLPRLGYVVAEHASSEHATHFVLAKRA